MTEARPDFAELDVLLGQLEQRFNPKNNLDHFPTAKPNLTNE